MGKPGSSGQRKKMYMYIANLLLLSNMIYNYCLMFVFILFLYIMRTRIIICVNSIVLPSFCYILISINIHIWYNSCIFFYIKHN